MSQTIHLCLTYYSGHDPHNVEVKGLLKLKIVASHKGQYTYEQVSRMFPYMMLYNVCITLTYLQRLYESQQRDLLNCQPENAGCRCVKESRRERVSEVWVEL